MEVGKSLVEKRGVHVGKSYSGLVGSDSGTAYVEEVRQQKKQAKYVVELLAWVASWFAWKLGTAEQAMRTPKAKTRGSINPVMQSVKCADGCKQVTLLGLTRYPSGYYLRALRHSESRRYSEI